MSETTEIVETAPKAFVTFERAVQVRPFETAKTSVMIQVPLEGVDISDQAALGAALKETCFVAKSTVFEQLGIEFTITPDLVVQEILERALSATEITPAEASRIAETANTVQSAAPRSAPSAGAKLTGRAAWEHLAANPSGWFDNRQDKANGKGSAKGPDFKKKGSGEGLWLTGRDGSSQVPEGVDLSALGIAA